MEEVLIEFVINKNGTIQSTVKGVKGPGCNDVTKALRQGLGEVVSNSRTTDYYATTTVSCRNHITVQQ